MTYFVTYGTAMACYAYWVLTKQDYILPDVRDRQFLLSFHKKAKREAWDAEKYNAIKDSLQVRKKKGKKTFNPLVFYCHIVDCLTFTFSSWSVTSVVCATLFGSGFRPLR